MDPHASTSRYILTALSIILVITAFILVGLNAFTLQNGGNILSFGAPSTAQLDAQYKAGYLAARAKEQALYPAVAMPITSLNGTITEITSDGFVVDASNVDTDMTADGLGSQRVVTLTDATVIQKVTMKSADQIAQEFGKTIKPGETPPSTVTTQKMNATDLQVGDDVTVATSDDARTTGQVTATSVNVH